MRTELRNGLDRLFNPQTMCIDIVKELRQSISGPVEANIYGNIGVEMEIGGEERMLALFPQLIILHSKRTDETFYYVYNAKTTKRFNVDSYLDFYDLVSESTGKELERIVRHDVPRNGSKR